MDPTNISTSPVSPTNPVNSSTASNSDASAGVAPLQVGASSAASSAQAEVNTSLSNNSQDPNGPSFNVKILIEQTVVQILEQLDNILSLPESLNETLPDSIRQDVDQALTNQLLAATPETLEDGLTAMIKANKDTADTFIQLTKALTTALNYQGSLPENLQTILQQERPALTDLMQTLQQIVQTHSQDTPEGTPSAKNPTAPSTQQPLPTGNGSAGSPPTSSNAASSPVALQNSPQESLATPGQNQANTTSSLSPSTQTSQPANSSSEQSSVTAQPNSSKQSPLSGETVNQATVAAKSSTETATLTNPTASQAESTKATLLTAPESEPTPSSQPNPASVTDSKPAASNQLPSTNQTNQASAAIKSEPQTSLPLSEETAPAATPTSTASSANTINPSNATAKFISSQTQSASDSAASLAKDFPDNSNLLDPDKKAPQSTADVIAKASTLQAAASQAFNLLDNPSVPQGPAGLDEFFNWIAKQLQNSPDGAEIQQNLNQNLAKLFQSFQDMPENDQQFMSSFYDQLEKQLPTGIRQAAEQIPGLKDLYIYQKMSNIARYAAQTPEELKDAKDKISRLAESLQKSLVASQSFQSESGSGSKIFSFFMPMSFDPQTTYPVYIHIFQQNHPEKHGGPNISETWLKLFIKTDYSGNVNLLFHVRQKNLEVKVHFSDPTAADDFYPCLPGIRQAVADDGSFSLQYIEVQKAKP